MTYTRICIATVVMFFSMFLFGPVAEADHCTQASAAGNYGFTLTGWLLLPTGAIPAAAVGRANVDAKGNVTGAEARSVAGGYADETFSGSLSINSDCTGSMTLNFFEAGQPVRTSVLSIVFVDNLQELRMVQKSLTLPNGATIPVVITADAKRIVTED
jgi:hypothetical protein